MTTTDTNPIRSRYAVGAIVPFLRIEFDASSEFESMGGLYLPWAHSLKNIDVKVLTCESEHLVAWDQDPEEKLNCVGYVFRGDDGSAWANQYPSASYGQLDTSNDDRVRLLDPQDPGEYFRPHVSAKTYLANLLRGVSQLEETEPTRSDLLQKHYEETVAKIEEVMPGFKVTFKPHVIQFTDGREPKVMEHWFDIDIAAANHTQAA